MLNITFLDNSVKQFNKHISCLEIAQSISPNFAKKCIIAILNDAQQVDLSYKISDDCKIKFITLDAKDENDKKILLNTIRHSCAHLLAHAIKELYGNKVQVTIGHVIENGFYYDFKTEDNFSFSVEDFSKIESKMKEIADRKIDINRTETTFENAIEYFQSIDEQFKCKIIEDLYKQ